MNLYLDTSAFIKLYVNEHGAAIARDAVAGASIVVTSAIAYVEARAGLARRHREAGMILSDYRRCLRDLDGDWPKYQRVAVTEVLIREAARVAETLHLRAYDAVHLASALFVANHLQAPVVFACWDSRLEEAARKAGLQILARA